ncbi:MAG TPA: hypothetical protein VIJ64_06235 [Candidatus Lustribacter sp.]
MIVDCFTFCDEFDLLELRLQVLDDVVDRFVLCEAPFTFRGDPKPLHFAAAAERFAPWRDRITALAYPGPANANPWLNEWGQRDFLATALTGCAPDDLILIGDCDEIPDPRSVARRPREGGILVHRMMFAQGYVNRAALAGTAVWNGTRALARASLARHATLSNVRKFTGAGLEVVEDGWHFTSLGGAAAMERKMRSYSHVELDIPYFRDRRRLEATYTTNEDMQWLPLDDRFPPALRENARWRPFVWDGPAAVDGAPARGLEHAHGCLAYVPSDAAGVAVVADNDGAAFAGVYADVRSLLAAVAAPAWVVLDRPERRATGALAELHGAGARVVAFAANARSLEVYGRVLRGSGTFPPGRALGRAEHEAAMRAAGYRIVAVERVFSPKLAIPLSGLTQHDVVVDSFAFTEIAPGALHDFLSDAFLFTLAGAPND